MWVVSGTWQHPLVLPFALAVAGPGAAAFFLTADNTMDRGAAECSVSDAARSGRAFAVATRAGLVVVDADTAHALERCRVFERAHPQLSVVHFTSGGGLVDGGKGEREHVYFVTPDGVTDDELRGALERAGMPPLQIRKGGRGGAIRPPLSPHRANGAGCTVGMADGDALRLLTPRVHSFSAAAGVAADSAGHGCARRPSRSRRPLPAQAQRLIHDGVAAHGSGKRRHASASLAQHMLGCGWTFQDFRGAHADNRNAIGDKYREIARERGADAAEKHLRDVWDWAESRHIPRAGRSAWTLETAELVTLWRGAAERWPYWTGTRDTDIAVVEALAARALKFRSLTVSPGIRQLSVDAGIGEQAAQASLKRLSQCGWVNVWKAPDSGPDAAQRVTLNGAYAAPLPLGDPGPRVGWADDAGAFLPERSPIWSR